MSEVSTKASSADTWPDFLPNATVALFEAQGAERPRPIGKNRWVVRRSVT